MSANSTKSARSKEPKWYARPDRPDPPYKPFPLFPHPSGSWAKKIRGKLHYFGRWGRIKNGEMVRLEGDGWSEAIQIFKAQWPDFREGRKPRQVQEDGELTLKDLCNRFLTSKLRKVELGKLLPRTLSEYRYTTARLLAQLGKDRPVEDLRADDFEKLYFALAKISGPVRLGNEITRTKAIFHYAYDNRLVGEPVNFGTEFHKPGRAEMRKHRAKSDKKLFESAEIRSLIKIASPTMRAGILLGINCGLGNTDIANLENSHLDLVEGWMDFARGKTGIGRRCPLWPETVEAIKQAIDSQPQPKGKADKDIVLLTARGERWVRVTEKSSTDGVTVIFGRLLRQLKFNSRKGLGFYSLRHTHATIGLQVRDRDASKALMGHAQTDMISIYDQSGPSDERLQAVVGHVRSWLFGEGRAK